MLPAQKVSAVLGIAEAHYEQASYVEAIEFY